MTKCLILGGNGFLGSNLADALLKQGHEVVIYDRFSRGMTNTGHLRDRVTIVRGDFSNIPLLSKTMTDVDYLFHYISTTNPATASQDPLADAESNLIGSLNLINCTVKNNIKKIIFPSSGGTIYGETTGKPIPENAPLNPVNPYAIVKMTLERYLHYYHDCYGMDYLILRYSNPYGPRQSGNNRQGVIPIFLHRIMRNEKPVIYGDGNAVRDYIYIDDAVAATLAALKITADEKIFNIGCGHGTSLNELITIMSKITNKKIDVEYRTPDRTQVSRIVLDISRIKNMTLWKPETSLEAGILRTWENLIST
jgi:UDP-glucose 4-epimerase